MYLKYWSFDRNPFDNVPEGDVHVVAPAALAGEQKREKREDDKMRNDAQEVFVTKPAACPKDTSTKTLPYSL